MPLPERDSKSFQAAIPIQFMHQMFYQKQLGEGFSLQVLKNDRRAMAYKTCKKANNGSLVSKAPAMNEANPWFTLPTVSSEMEPKQQLLPEPLESCCQSMLT